MRSTTIDIPSIRDNESGYDYLFKLSQYVISDPHKHFIFNFKKCALLDQNAVAIFGGLARFVEAHNGIASSFISHCRISFQVENMSQLIKKQLIENNFLFYFSDIRFSGLPTGDYIGYREHEGYLDPNEIAMHLNYEWLSDEIISLSKELKNIITSRILEIFMNAYGHGVMNSKLQQVGVTSCGQFYRKEKKLKLTVVDFGCGVVENVQKHLNSKISSVNAMKWALETGNSTKTDSISDNIPRGLGFGLLSDFVSLNSGQLVVYSNSCCAKVEKNNKFSVSEIKTPFTGTVVNIEINCGNKQHYFLSNSASEQYF